MEINYARYGRRRCNLLEVQVRRLWELVYGINDGEAAI